MHNVLSHFEPILVDLDLFIYLTILCYYDIMLFFMLPLDMISILGSIIKMIY